MSCSGQAERPDIAAVARLCHHLRACTGVSVKTCDKMPLGYSQRRRLSISAATGGFQSKGYFATIVPRNISA